MEIGLTLQPFGYALKRGVHGDVRVGNEEHRTTCAIVRLDDAPDRPGLPQSPAAPRRRSCRFPVSGGRRGTDRHCRRRALPTGCGSTSADRGSGKAQHTFRRRTVEMRLAAADLLEFLLRRSTKKASLAIRRALVIWGPRSFSSATISTPSRNDTRTPGDAPVWR